MSTTSNTRAPDPRPARTRAAIVAAVERLGASGAEVNVSSIVKEAGLSRSSFYSQFKDVGDIAVQLVSELLSELIENATTAREANDKPDEEIALGTIELFLTEFNARRRLYAALLADSGDAGSQVKVCTMMTQLALPAFVRHTSATTDPNYDAEFVARFVAAGTLANVIAWVSSEQPISIEEMKLRLFSALPGWVFQQVF